MKFIKNYSLLVHLVLIFSIDRISKYLMINAVHNSGKNKIFNSEFLNFELIWNKGIAFGLLAFDKVVFYHIITTIIFIVIAILIFLYTKSYGFEKYAYILISGGALGNLYDRILYNAVPDFIDFHINNFHWFIFNVADIFITLGVILLICFEIFFKRKI